MSWLSKKLGLDVRFRELIPKSFLSQFEIGAYQKALRQLDDDALRAFSRALDNEWMERMRKANQ